MLSLLGCADVEKEDCEQRTLETTHSTKQNQTTRENMGMLCDFKFAEQRLDTWSQRGKQEPVEAEIS